MNALGNMIDSSIINSMFSGIDFFNIDNTLVT